MSLPHLPVPPVQSCLFCGEDEWSEEDVCPSRATSHDAEVRVLWSSLQSAKRELREQEERVRRLEALLQSVLTGPPVEMSTGGRRVGLPDLVPVNSTGMRLVIDRLHQVCAERDR